MTHKKYVCIIITCDCATRVTNYPFCTCISQRTNSFSFIYSLIVQPSVKCKINRCFTHCIIFFLMWIQSRLGSLCKSLVIALLFITTREKCIKLFISLAKDTSRLIINNWTVIEFSITAERLFSLSLSISHSQQGMKSNQMRTK